MAWLPPPGGKLLDAAAKRAASVQRRTFLHMLGLRMGDVLQSLDGRSAATKQDVQRVTGFISEAADALYAFHETELPDCHRAPAHLQVATLALASQRVLLEEARRREDNLLVNDNKVRHTVANALGVVSLGFACVFVCAVV